MDNPENKDVRWWIQHIPELKISQLYTPVIFLNIWHRDTETYEGWVIKNFVEECTASFQYGSEPCLCQPNLTKTAVSFNLYITL